MVQIRDYDTAVTLIADADYITKGRLLGGGVDRDGQQRYTEEPEAGPSSGAVSSGTGAGTFLAHQHTSQYSDDDRRKVEQGQSPHAHFISELIFFAHIYSHRRTALFGRDQVPVDIPRSISARVDAPTRLARCAFP